MCRFTCRFAQQEDAAKLTSLQEELDSIKVERRALLEQQREVFLHLARESCRLLRPQKHLIVSFGMPLQMSVRLHAAENATPEVVLDMESGASNAMQAHRRASAINMSILTRVLPKPVSSRVNNLIRRMLRSNLIRITLIIYIAVGQLLLFFYMSRSISMDDGMQDPQ